MGMLEDRAKANDLTGVRDLLAKGGFCAELLTEAATAAAGLRHMAIVKLLHSRGARAGDVLRVGVRHELIEVVQWAVAAGADVNQRVPEKEGGGTRTLLHEAAEWGSPGAARELIHAGAQVDARDSRGRAPLLVAAMEEAGATACKRARAIDMRQAAAEGRLRARRLADPDIVDRTAVEYLLEAGADPNALDSDGRGAMFLFGAFNRSEVNPIDDPFNDEERERRGLACRIQAALLNAGAKPDSLIDLDLANSVRNKDETAVRKLLAQGASATATDPRYAWGPTPLAWAAASGSLEIAKQLVQAGADVNDGGRRLLPLLEAARMGRLEMVKYLVSQGAEVNRAKPPMSEESRPENALSGAKDAGRNEVVRYLMSVGAKMPDEVKKTFAPGLDVPNTFVELVVRAPVTTVADAVASCIGGKARYAVWGKRLKAGKRSFSILRLAGSDWCSVVRILGASPIIDPAWEKLAETISAECKARCVLLCYEDVSSCSAYRIYENGQEVERYDEGLGEEADDTVFISTRGRSLVLGKAGTTVLSDLAVEEGFRAINYGPAAKRGSTVEFALRGLDYEIADASLATT
jgi:ankyrin repeat protein